MMSPVRRGATIDDFLAIPEEDRFHELIGGEIVPKASPSGEHGDAQGGVLSAIRPPFQRRSGGPGGPGGWWILPEVEVLLPGVEGMEIVRPDIVGWRRERCPERPTGMPVKQRPDWICEVVSPTNEKNDNVKTLRLYHHAAIPHYWMVDAQKTTLTVMHGTADGDRNLMCAERGETVRAAPFQQIELVVGTLFGDDPPEPPEA